MSGVVKDGVATTLRLAVGTAVRICEVGVQVACVARLATRRVGRAVAATRELAGGTARRIRRDKRWIF